LEDDDLRKFCVFVVVGVRAAPPDILTDLSSVEGHARAHT
jgi:hypothetical protein